jgi:hypothetical protein
MKQINLFIAFLCVVATGCSSASLRKTIIYSSMAGCAAGGAGGFALSPEGDRNKRANTAIFCGVGALVAGGAGYLLYKDNPSNQQLEKRISPPRSIDDDEALYRINSTKNSISINPRIGDMKALRVTDEEIPESLRARLPRNRVIIKEVQEQRIQKNGETIIIDPHKMYILSTEQTEAKR